MSLFKRALSDAIATSGKTPSKFADDIGIGRSRISEFLSEKPTLPKDDTLVLICNAFDDQIARSLAQAWIRERLEDRIADLLTQPHDQGSSKLEKLLASLPPSTRKAFEVLIESARVVEDLRSSLESLASFIAPKDEPPSQLTDPKGPTDAPAPQSSSTQEISDTPTVPTAASRSSTTGGQPKDPNAKIVKLRAHIISESEKKAPKKNGTED